MEQLIVLLLLVIALWEGVKQAFSRIENEVANYAEPLRGAMRTSKRLELLTKFQAEALNKITQFRDEYPKLKAERTKSAAQALANLRRGLPPDGGRRPVDEPVIDTGALIASERALLGAFQGGLRTIAARLQTIESMTEARTALALLDRETTESIGDRIRQYAEDATAGAEFSYRSWAIESALLPLVLASRQASGDDRAGILLQQLPAIWGTLMRRTLPPELSDTDLEDLNKTEGLIQGVIRNGAENIKPLDDWLSFLGRGLARRKEFEDANGTPQPPKPRVETIPPVLTAAQNVLNPGPGPTPPVARFWS